jgi:Putative prokaryotic signal transducing protein
MDSPYELQRLVVVATFSSPWEAQIAQARLSAEGLHSLIADEHVIRMVALANAVGGIRLKVRERDAAAAADVLRRLAPLPEIYLVTQDAASDGEAGGGIGDDGATGAGSGGPSGTGPSGPSGTVSSSLSGPIEATETRTAAGGTAAPTAIAGSRGAPLSGAPGPWEDGVESSSPRCPACDGADLRVERSSRLLLGVLPMSRWGYRCGDCGVLWKPDEIESGRRLEPTLPETSDGVPVEAGNAPLITVARFSTPWEAHLARTLLESEGLRCCVLEERMPAVHLLSAAPAAFNRLEVHQADAQRAGEILARAYSYPALVAAPDPETDLDPDAQLDSKGNEVL